MNYYHLTILRDGEYFTVYATTTSISNYLAIEQELGRKTYVLYSREMDKEEYERSRDQHRP
ncbi:MAG TPA: hypothetical protein PK181_07290 [Methanothrix soehngenii]|nr:hypothetical protein [Methanothrix soehngenii]